MKKNISFALCDNEKTDLALTEEMLRSWLDENSYSASEILTFGDTQSLEDHITSGSSSDIYILSIPTHGAAAVALGKMIAARCPNSPIICISHSKNYAFPAYTFHAVRYLLKPLMYEEFASALDFAELVSRVSPGSTITVRMTGEKRSIKDDDVLYIENNVRSMRYFLRDGRTLNGTRRNISFENYFAALLASGEFVQTHKSFIVNVRCITALRTSSVLLSNGAHVPISRKHLSEVRGAFERYDRK